jgi:uncharacterized membrane protein YeaQ/YmgE (transglycosylase-associated protein family)
MTIVAVLLILLACSWAASHIAKPKNRHGALLGFLLGPVGVAIAALLPPRAAPAPTDEQQALAEFRAEHVPASEEYKARHR